MNPRPVLVFEGVADKPGTASIRATWLAWGTSYEELQNGVGQYPVAIVELNDGTVVEFPLHRIKFIKEKQNDI